MTVQERIEIIRMLELMNKHETFCQQTGIYDNTNFRSDQSGDEFPVRYTEPVVKPSK